MDFATIHSMAEASASCISLPLVHASFKGATAGTTTTQPERCSRGHGESQNGQAMFASLPLKRRNGCVLTTASQPTNQATTCKQGAALLVGILQGIIPGLLWRCRISSRSMNMACLKYPAPQAHADFLRPYKVKRQKPNQFPRTRNCQKPMIWALPRVCPFCSVLVLFFCLLVFRPYASFFSGPS